VIVLIVVRYESFVVLVEFREVAVELAFKRHAQDLSFLGDEIVPDKVLPGHVAGRG